MQHYATIPQTLCSMTLWLTPCLWSKTFSRAPYQDVSSIHLVSFDLWSIKTPTNSLRCVSAVIKSCMKEAQVHMYATLCNYPTDLVLHDVVADTVLVVKDLLTGTVSRCLKHSFGIIWSLIHQNNNKQSKMRLSGHQILHERSTSPHVCNIMQLSHRPCARCRCGWHRACDQRPSHGHRIKMSQAFTWYHLIFDPPKHQQTV